jgi:nicotinamide mononucleotide transporter
MNQWLEPVAALLGLISIGLMVQRNILTFPIGIVMVALYVVIFYEAKFYADMLLQVAYIFLQIQGWYLWSGSQQARAPVAIRRVQHQQWMYGLLSLAALALLLGFVLRRFTDAALPWLDAFTTSLSLLAQWWTNRRYVESWLLWIAVDAVYLYQYSYKTLYFTTALYAAFLLLAVAGYREWRRATELQGA